MDDLPRPGQLGPTRVGGINLDSPRTRSTLAAVATLSAAPKGFTVAELAAKVHALTGQAGSRVSIVVWAGCSRHHATTHPAAWAAWVQDGRARVRV